MASNTDPEQPLTLADLMQSIPQEVYDEIYTLVFETSPRKLVVIDKNHKPPSLLQVDRASRATFAKAYYRNSIIVLDGRTSHKFIDKMPVEHIKLMRNVQTVESLAIRSRTIYYGRKHNDQWKELVRGSALRRHCHAASMWAWLVEGGWMTKAKNQAAREKGRKYHHIKRDKLRDCCEGNLAELDHIEEWWFRKRCTTGYWRT